MTVSNRYNKTLILVLLSLLTLSHQNCSQFEAQKDLLSQQSMLQHKVFTPFSLLDSDAMVDVTTNPPAGGGNGTAVTPEECLASRTCEYEGTILVVNPPSSINQPVDYYCSNGWTSAQAGVNIKTAGTLKVGFINPSTGAVVCEVSSPSIKESLLNEKAIKADIPVGSCPGLVKGTYDMLLTTSDKSLPGTGTLQSRSLIIAGNSGWSSGKPYKVNVTIDAGGYIRLASANGVNPQILFKNNTKKDNANCDEVRSPLVVQLTTQPKRIKLSAPLDGVLFNIAGYNDAPTLNVQHQISWFTPGDASGHYYITLPDASGQVLGIDQMFGDSTRGPDGAFAANGYEALRKWDGRLANGTYDSRARDGVIDRDDAVFSQLRLWADANVNGIAETIELQYMEQAGLASISLNYDPNYGEVDRFGNQIKMKSFAYGTDDTPYLVYDIWFRITD